jgi:predicted permease
MTWLSRLTWWRHARSEEDFAEEIRSHLELEAAQREREGTPVVAAQAAARRSFGNVAGWRERYRESRRIAWLDQTREDLRSAFRGLRREPLFTGFVVTTFALCIGANAAAFGVVDRLLLSGPAHVRAADRVVRLYRVTREHSEEDVESRLEFVQYTNLLAFARAFDGLAAYSMGKLRLGDGEGARLITSGSATANFFPLLGVAPVVGRFFTSEEDRPLSAKAVIVLGYGLWRSGFGGDRAVVGQSIVLSGTRYEIVGVAPKGFTGVELGRVDVWRPLSLVQNGTVTNWAHNWNSQWLRVVGRRKPGFSPPQADSDATLAHRRSYDGGQKLIGDARISTAPLGYTDQARESTEATVARWLVGVTVVVLLIACSNVINLLLARAVKRRREVAIRLALGAGRRRLVRLLLAESLLLSVLGGAAGLVVAYGGGEFVRGTLLPNVEWVGSPVNVRVLALSAIVALIAGAITGLVPAMRASRPDLVPELRASSAQGGDRGSRLRGALTITQTALSVILLVAAGLFVRSLANARALDLGVQPERVLTAYLPEPGFDEPGGDAKTVHERAKRTLDRVRLLPGVEHASLSIGLPFNSSFGVSVRIPGWDTIPRLNTGRPDISAVGSDYFTTVGMRTLRGRVFTESDRAGSEPVAIVNATMAATVWPARDAIGQCLFVFRPDSLPCWRVVGVVQDARRFQLREEPSMHYYVPFGQDLGIRGTLLLVRPSGDPAALAPSLRRLLYVLYPSSGYLSVQRLQEQIDPQVRPWRLGATMFGFCAILALLVATVGLYSVISYLVSQRTREIGVRIALGARDANIFALILRNSVGLASIGIAIGLALVAAGGRLLEPLLFNATVNDPVVIGTVSVTLVLAAVLAGAVPALRARRVDPLAALRAE